MRIRSIRTSWAMWCVGGACWSVAAVVWIGTGAWLFAGVSLVMVFVCSRMVLRRWIT